MKAGRLLAFLLSLLASGCSHQEPPAATAVSAAPAFETFSISDYLKTDGAPQCKAMLDTYCTSLYSPKARGNLELSRGPSSIRVLQGETENQFSQVYYSYSMAKLRNRRGLPSDLLRSLENNGYFSKLSRYLARKPREKMNLSQRITDEWAGYEVRSAWSAAMAEVTLARASKKYPGFHAIPDGSMPIEWSLEKRRIQRTLVSEVSRALWRDDKNWKKVEEGFQHLKDSFLAAIERMDIGEKLRENWSDRIREVSLVLPGSLPSIANEECSTTTINAYYYTQLNFLTVCAGDFNSEDILQTVAHEMAHALDLERSLYLFQSQSKFGLAMADFRDNVCHPQRFSCEDWNSFKGKFDEKLASLQGFKADVPDFQRCLKRRPTSKPLGEDDLDRMVQAVVASRLSELASNDAFLRITKKNVPYLDGKSGKNPNYLNPCNYYLWSQGEEPVSDALSTMMFFTAEYRCSELPPMEKMKAAIELSKSLTTKILTETFRAEGEFSAHPVLEKEGFSSSPSERFADVMGSYAMAELLKEIPSVADRKSRFLASSSWQCMEPSLASHFPEESAVEKQYVFDSHTEGEQRRKELFSAPIRKTLGCEKDFEFQECSLPFRR